MESLGVLLSVLCCFAILAGPAVLAAPSTTAIPRTDAARPNVGICLSEPLPEPKNTENKPNPSPWIHVGRAEDTVQPEGRLTRDSSRSKEESVRDAQHSKHAGDPRGDGVSRSSHQRGSAVDLSSHDATLPDSGAISARQAKRSVGNYPASSSSSSSASSSISNTSGDDVARRSIDSSGSNLKDLGVAEDRYPPRYPYRYQQQYSNQRYRPNDRRDPYRNYPRYPVFPGK